MNFRNKMLLEGLVIILFVFNIGSALGFEYSLKPGSEEWRNLSVEEKNELLQIPDSILSVMPTEELIQAYVDNPFCSLIFVYNTIQDGFNRVYNEFNGLRELMKRNDAATKLIDFYKNMQVDGYSPNWEPDKKGEFTFKFVYIETLLSQPEIVRQLNLGNTKILISELIEKYEGKVEHVSEHSIVGLESCTYAIAHTLYQNGKLAPQGVPIEETMQSFLETGHLLQNNTLDQVLQQARSFVQE